jgi:hypothetical protein
LQAAGCRLQVAGVSSELVTYNPYNLPPAGKTREEGGEVKFEWHLAKRRKEVKSNECTNT